MSVDQPTNASIVRPRLIPSLGLNHLPHILGRLGRRLRSPRNPPAAAPPGTLPLDGPDPFPRAANFPAAALPLASPHVAVLLNNTPDTTPDALPLRKRMHIPQHIVPQIRQEEPAVVEVLIPQLLLISEPAENSVDEARDLGRGGTVTSVLGPQVEDCLGEQG